MFPSQHLLIGTVFVVLLYLAFPSIGIDGAIIILASTVLIDIDHYIYYIYEKGNWNPLKAYHWFRIKHASWLRLSREERNKHRGIIFFLHGIETQIIWLLLGIFVHRYFLFVFIGFMFHLFLDLVYAKRFHDRLDKVSVIYDYFKFKKLNG